jgi:CHASE2 domain-containing sensor protein
VPATENKKPPIPVWLLSATFIGAFVVGGLGLIFHTWVVFWIGVAIAVLCLPAGLLMNVMDYTEEYPVPQEFEDPRP